MKLKEKWVFEEIFTIVKKINTFIKINIFNCITWKSFKQRFNQMIQTMTTRKNEKCHLRSFWNNVRITYYIFMTWMTILMNKILPYGF